MLDKALKYLLQNLIDPEHKKIIQHVTYVLDRIIVSELI
jgi:hypothetical protein